MPSLAIVAALILLSWPAATQGADRDVTPGGEASAAPNAPDESAAPTTDTPDLRSPEDARAKALAAIRDHVEKNSDYVGLNFTAEARAMHSGEKPHRAIYGEARTEDARKLIEDGVPVAPLPFTPKAKTN